MVESFDPAGQCIKYVDNDDCGLEMPIYEKHGANELLTLKSEYAASFLETTCKRTQKSRRIFNFSYWEREKFNHC